MGKRHLTPDEIKMQMKVIARESRMAERSPWTAMGIVCGYTLMKSEGFKGHRIANVHGTVDRYEKMWRDGELKIEVVRQELMDKADWTIDHKAYTPEDIRHKKGSFDYYMDLIQIDPQNRINEMSGRYMLFFFKALNELYGYGKDRLTRVEEALNSVIDEYREDKGAIAKWKQALLDDAGVYFEPPVDPLTQKSGSFMCGC